MPRPTLNFVWVGPPRFDQGGQDVIGPETIDRNFKTFYNHGNLPNPMVFWCQEAYVDQYKAYFADKGITIRVSSIEECLETSITAREHANVVLHHYRKLILSHERNKVVDRVYMKDMLFNFIIATQGNYVLDTNIQANLKEPVHFPEYSTFMCPWITNETGKKMPEVWIQYAPPSNLERAKECLNHYLDLYEKAAKDFQTNPYSTKYHNFIGEPAAKAICLSKELSIETFQSSGGNIWDCVVYGRDDVVPELGIIKEYYNSHCKDKEYDYGGPHLHVILANIERLTFDLDHGVSPDLEANPSYIYHAELPYKAEHETLLHLALRRYNLMEELSNRENFLICAKLLLARGADANKVHTITYKREPTVTIEESALTYAIKSGSSEVVQMLFTSAKTPIQIDQIVNNQSALMLAVIYNPDIIPWLIQAKGADPNQVWPGQQDTPLTIARCNHNKIAERLLLELGADPNTVISQIAPKKDKHAFDHQLLLSKLSLLSEQQKKPSFDKASDTDDDNEEKPSTPPG